MQKMADEKFDDGAQVEALENGGASSLEVDMARHEAGSLQLLDAQHIVLVPTPSRDPKGE